ncbi:MAG: hypothetical protein CVT95_12930, partial [Bacteroidetes bacterium HGW-Bacteroidetes-12]
KGALTIIKAKFAPSPLKKFVFFKEGKSMIEQAVSLSPKNIEIRYLRVLMQEKSPIFLNYKENIKEDISFVVNQIVEAELTLKVKYKIISNLVEANLISYEQKLHLFNRLNKP